MSPLRYAVLAALALAGCGRADRLGAYGFAAGTSPTLDALAAEGVVLERAIAASTKTAPATAAFVGNSVLQRRVGLDAGFGVYDDELPTAETNRPGFFERRSGPSTERALAWLAARPRQGSFRWRPGAAPELAARDVPPAKALVAYREGRKKVRYHGEALTAEEVARLRALGYAVPEPEED